MQHLIGKMIKNRFHRIIGLSIICVSILILLHSAYMYYCYNFTNLLFLFKIPNYILFSNAIFGMIGIFISVKFLTGKMRGKLYSLLIAILSLVTLSNYLFPIM